MGIGPISRQVHAESWLVRESDSLIKACSTSDEITELFGPELSEIRVIRNGIDADLWLLAPRRPRTGPPELLYLGRLEYEKGVHDAIAALPISAAAASAPRDHHYAGDGTQQQMASSIQQARKHKVLKATRIRRTARSGEELLRCAAEGRRRGAAQLTTSRSASWRRERRQPPATPLVTSNVGGLGEAVIDGQTGMSFAPRDVASLGLAVRAVLDDPEAAQRRALYAPRERLSSTSDWHTVAAETSQVYLAAKRAEREPHPPRRSSSTHGPTADSTGVESGTALVCRIWHSNVLPRSR